MKKYINYILIFCLLFISSASFGARQTLAAGNLYLSPASGSYGQGSTLKVDVGVNTGGDLVNAVQANVAYPTDKLQFVSVATGGSALTIFADRYASGGVVRIGGGTPGAGFSGSRHVATIFFKVLNESGSGTLSMSGGSAVLRSSDNQNILTGGGSATYSFTNKPATQSGSVDTQAFKISDIKAGDIGKNSAVVVWKTDTKSTSLVEYGLNNSYGLVNSSTDLTTEHSVKLTSALLAPGVTYHFRVVSVDSESNETKSEDAIFTTLGFSIQIKITDKNGHALTGAKVLIYPGPNEATVDHDGLVRFDNATLGKLPVSVEYKGKSQIDQIEVKDADELQTFDIKFLKGTSFFSFKWLIVLLALLAASGALWSGSRLLIKFKNRPYSG